MDFDQSKLTNPGQWITKVLIIGDIINSLILIIIYMKMFIFNVLERWHELLTCSSSIKIIKSLRSKLLLIIRAITSTDKHSLKICGANTECIKSTFGLVFTIKSRCLSPFTSSCRERFMWFIDTGRSIINCGRQLSVLDSYQMTLMASVVDARMGFSHNRLTSMGLMMFEYCYTYVYYRMVSHLWW